MRPKSKVFDHFIESKVNEKTIYTCSFCRHVFKFRNSTKFSQHLTKCDKSPEDVKNLFKTVKSDLSPAQSQTNTSANFASTSQSSIGENCNDMNIHQAIARAVYVTGAPLSLLEHPLWKDALHMLNPLYNPPSRKVLSTSLLEKEYTEMQTVIERTVNQASVLHLAIDGWSNLRNESILNVMIYVPKPYFYKFIATEDNRHTADYLFEKISEILDHFGAEKFLGIISDNAANMAKLGDMLKKKNTHLTWVGCLAHTLHLWIGDILKASKVRYMFSQIVEIIKSIKTSHVLNARFIKIAEEKNINSTLVLPVKTRWGSYLFCLQSFLKSKLILQNIVINEENQQLQKYKTKLLDEEKWHELKELEEFLKPTVDWILKLEGDYCAVHLVHQAFKELSEVVSNPLTTQLLGDDTDIITTKFYDRKRNALKPIHVAAAILDPKNQGCNLTTEEHLEGCEFIINTNVSNINNAQMVFEEFNNYKNRTDVWQKEFAWQMAKSIAPVLWWQSLYSKTKLGEIAIKILSVPATSSSVERSFSTFSNIHTNKRNRLKTDRAGKICFISHNWKLINRSNSTSSGGPETDASLEINFDNISDSEDDFKDETEELNPTENEENIILDDVTMDINNHEVEDIEDPLNTDGVLPTHTQMYPHTQDHSYL